MKEMQKFHSAEEMLKTLNEDMTDLYNPKLEQYVFNHSDKGSICVYSGISIEQARTLAKETQGIDGWSSELGWQGSAIYDDVTSDHYNKLTESNIEYCDSVFKDANWMSCEEFSKTNPLITVLVEMNDIYGKELTTVESDYCNGQDLGTVAQEIIANAVKKWEGTVEERFELDATISVTKDGMCTEVDDYYCDVSMDDYTVKIGLGNYLVDCISLEKLDFLVADKEITLEMLESQFKGNRITETEFNELSEKITQQHQIAKDILQERKQHEAKMYDAENYAEPILEDFF